MLYIYSRRGFNRIHIWARPNGEGGFFFWLLLLFILPPHNTVRKQIRFSVKIVSIRFPARTPLRPSARIRGKNRSFAVPVCAFARARVVAQRPGFRPKQNRIDCTIFASDGCRTIQMSPRPSHTPSYTTQHLIYDKTKFLETQKIPLGVWKEFIYPP